MWKENEIYTELVGAFKLFNIVNPISQKGEEIFNAVQNHYVTGNPRVWWLSFKTAPKSYYFEDNDGFHHIKDILIKNNITPPKIVYFIADIDDEFETNPVFKLNLDEVSNILEECQFFEYYICPLDLSWLICENDHNQILFISNPE